MLYELEEQYPQLLRAYLKNNRSRFVYEIQEVIKFASGQGSKFLDIGAGFSPLPIICALHGMKVTVVDDFLDPVHQEVGLDVLSVHKKYGVEVMHEDVFSLDLPFGENQLDGVVILDSMEHWHRSPKRLFHRLYNMLKRGGLFLIGVPNCVNARKRITVPFGRGKWSSMSDWYENEIFRGHVREPDVHDLRYMADDLRFREYRIVGKNWIGYRSRNMLIRIVTPFVDKALQLNPALCSDIYLVAKK